MRMSVSRRWGAVCGAILLSLGVSCFTPTDDARGPQACVIDTVTNLASPTALSLFGDPIYFAAGTALAPGTYRLENEGGCMKYGPGQSWTSNAYANGDVGWWIIGSTTSVRLVIPPGTVGFERISGSADREVGSADEDRACSHRSG